MKEGSPVVVCISHKDYPAVVKSVQVSALGKLIAFSAQILGSGMKPVRRLARDENQTWRRPS